MVKVEGSKSCASLKAIVVGKFSRHKVFIPVVLERCGVRTEHIFYCSVSTLCLAVSLRVMGSGHFKIGTQTFMERSPEMGGETRVTVRYDDLREAKVPENLLEEELSIASSINSAGAGHKNDALA